MSNLFKIKFEVNSVPNCAEKFKLAFKNIYRLSKLLCDSEDELVKEFISSVFPDDPPWLSVTSGRIPKVIIMAECCSIVIAANDCDEGGIVEYDFGKRAPADDVFLFAIMSIIKHYIPTAELFHEAYYYKEDFDDGVRLARLVNPHVRNPYTKSEKLRDNLSDTDRIKEICKILDTDYSDEITPRP